MQVKIRVGGIVRNLHGHYVRSAGLRVDGSDEVRLYIATNKHAIPKVRLYIATHKQGGASVDEVL